jgi:hypothetical protein
MAGLKMGIGIFLGIILVSSGAGVGGYFLGKSAGIADASGGGLMRLTLANGSSLPVMEMVRVHMRLFG